MIFAPVIRRQCRGDLGEQPSFVPIIQPEPVKVCSWAEGLMESSVAKVQQK